MTGQADHSSEMSPMRKMSNARIVKPMHIHRSNRVEALLPALAQIVSVPPSDPFEPEMDCGAGTWNGEVALP